MSGYTFAQRIRKAGNHVPIIFLTAKNTENDMLTGFSVGGDDYIAKPFSVKEVLARVRAVCRRTQPVSFQSEEESIIVFEPWRIDLDTKEFSIDGQPVKLTKTEFQLLVFLTRHPNKVYPRDTIIDKVWEDSTYITERTVDVHITRLRKKLGKYANRIENRSGFGYRFNPTADEIDA
jgi:DNA-binding response OmpR family regulator